MQTILGGIAFGAILLAHLLALVALRRVPEPDASPSRSAAGVVATRAAVLAAH